MHGQRNIKFCPLSCDANLKKNAELARCKTRLKSQQYLYAVSKYASLLFHPNYRNRGLSFNLTVMLKNWKIRQ